MEPKTERQTPADAVNELYRKQIFADSTPQTDEPENDTTSAQSAAPLAFDKPAVLDERFAARKAAREAENAQKTPSAKRPVTAAQKSSKRSPHTTRRTALGGEKERRLYSGEAPADAASRIVRQFAALLLCVLLVFGGFALKSFAWDLWTDRDIDEVRKSTFYTPAVKCDTLTLDKSLPFGYDAAQAVCTALNQPMPDTFIPEKNDDTLVFPADLTSRMESALNKQTLRLESGMTNTDLFKQIYKSLAKKQPVIVLMLIPGAESAELQYGVVTGLDVDNNRVNVSMNDSPDTYTLADFIAATRFESARDIPLQLRVSLLFGTLSRNTAIFLK